MARLALLGEQRALGHSADRGLAAAAHDGGRQLPFEAGSRDGHQPFRVLLPHRLWVPNAVRRQS
jgi:hypothetical protein